MIFNLNKNKNILFFSPGSHTYLVFMQLECLLRRIPEHMKPLIPAGCTADRKLQKSNIIVILVGDLGLGDVSAYGQTTIEVSYERNFEGDRPP